MIRLNKLRLRLAFMFVLTLSYSLTQAQSDPTGETPVTTTYALTNANVITSPGSMQTEATVVIREGLILNVGKNISIPANAQEIDATGLYIYSAFIDGMSNTGAKRPDAMERPRNLFTPDPPNGYAGITPENSVVSQLDITSSSIASMRKNGFAVSHTVPYGRMLPGSGSLIVLKDATHPDDLVMAKDVALYAQWVGAPGAYPNNILGMMAKWRNLYRNAEQDKKHADMYAENPSGLPRPTGDRVSQAFYPIVTKEKPVMFDVSGMLDVRRAMRLQNDLGFTLMVAGVEQSFELVDELKATGTPIFLSMDLPKEPKEIKVDDKSEEVSGLEARRMEFYQKHVSQAALLESNGIKFGFSAKGTSAGKIMANIKTMIDNGLSEDAALAALTTSPAQLLGIDQMVGTVESGKMANLMVRTAPVFEKGSQIQMMFIDGEKYEYEVKTKKSGNDDSAEAATEAPAPGAYAAIIGSWTYTFVTPQGEQTGKMIIRNGDDGLEGTFTSDDGSPDQDMSDISFRDNELNFNFDVDAGGQSIQIVVQGTVTGKNYEAEATVEAFNITLELTAVKDEK